MVKYEMEDIEVVMETTGLNKTEAEKYFVQVAKDLGEEAECSLDVLDVIHYETEAKANGTRKEYVTTQKKTTKKPREKKIDKAKQEIIDIIFEALIDYGYDDAVIVNPDKLIEFEDFSINLVRHRPKKG